jgi:hypothetical protein
VKPVGGIAVRMDHESVALALEGAHAHLLRFALRALLRWRLLLGIP